MTTVQRTTRPLTLPLAVAALLVGVAAGAEVVSLDAASAGARAVAASHVAAAAASRSRAAAALVGAADAAALPSLTASAGTTRRSSVPEFAMPTGGPSQPDTVLVPDITMTYGVGLRAAQVLWAGGAVDASRAAAREEETAAHAASLTTTADTKLAGRAAYWQAVRALAGVATARAAETRALRLKDDAAALFAAGMAVNADVLGAEERLASARAVVARVTGAAANAESQLRSLLDLGGDVRIELADSLEAAPPPLPEPLPDLQGEALSRRPELVASGARAAALLDRETQVKAAVRPSVAAVALLDYSRPNARYFPQSDEWKDSWSVGLVASWTLFDGGRAGADAAATRAEREAVLAEDTELRRRILLDVAMAHRDLGTALEVLPSTEAARAAATAREQAVRERYQAGVATMVETLDAQETLTSAEVAQINARAAAWLAMAVLDRAVGR
jgi:outer membrane protein TolC